MLGLNSESNLFKKKKKIGYGYDFLYPLIRWVRHKYKTLIFLLALSKTLE